jgi:hypothetical protein
MTKDTKMSIYFGSAFSLGALLVTWLLTGHSSPFYSYFLFHETLPNIWRALSVVPFIVATVVSGGSHSFNQPVFWITFCVQWFLIGFLVSLLIRKSLMR